MAQADFIAAAVELIATDGYRLLTQYRFDPHTGLWRHSAGPATRTVTVADVGYDGNGEMTYPRLPGSAGEDAFPDYLRLARAILAGLPSQVDDGPTGLSPEFESLRWFPLPPGCLAPAPAGLQTVLGAQPRPLRA